MRARVGTEGQRTVVTGDTKDVWSLGRECRGLRASFFPPCCVFVRERPLSHVQQFVVVAVGIPLYVTLRFIYGHLGRVQLGVTNTPSVALSSTGRRLRRGRRCRVTGARGLGLADAPRGL